MSDPNKSETEKISFSFIKAFEQGNEKQLEQLLSEDVINYVTNAQGGVDKLEGRKSYLDRIKAMNISSVKLKLNITQLLVINAHQALVMIEVKAQRHEKTLHNHAAFLVNIKNNQISEMWMVEALPAYSDTFWKE